MFVMLHVMFPLPCWPEAYLFWASLYTRWINLWVRRCDSPRMDRALLWLALALGGCDGTASGPREVTVKAQTVLAYAFSNYELEVT